MTFWTAHRNEKLVWQGEANSHTELVKKLNEAGVGIKEPLVLRAARGTAEVLKFFPGDPRWYNPDGSPKVRYRGERNRFDAESVKLHPTKSRRRRR